MPSLVIKLANPYVAGLILAAPYGAVLSTVSGWLLIVSSGLVRDLYQRFLRPTASSARSPGRATRRRSRRPGRRGRSRSHPPKYLQLIIVFSSTGMASAFLMPALLGCFWRRATAAGAIAAMVDRRRRSRSASTCSARSVPNGLRLAWLFGPNPRDRRPGQRSGPTTCSASTPASGASRRRCGRPDRQPRSRRRPTPKRVALLFDVSRRRPAPATLDCIRSDSHTESDRPL